MTATGHYMERLNGLVVEDGPLLSAWVLRTGEPLICPDLATDPRSANLKRVGFCSGIAYCAPVKASGAPRWAVLVLHPEERSPSQETYQHLVATADLAGLALEQLELRCTADRQFRHLLALHEVSRLLSMSLDLATILTLSIDVGMGLFDLDRCCVLLREERGVIVAAGRGLSREQAKSLCLPPEVTPDPDALGWDPESTAILPIAGREQPIGYLAIERGSAPLGEPELRLLSIWTSLAGVVIENARLVASIDHARRDLVTLLLSAGRQPVHAHARRVAEIAVAIANRLGMSGTLTRETELAALLLSIGELIQAHGAENQMVEAAKLVQDSPSLRSVAPLVRHHRERWDGKGKPDGLRGEAIPLGARVLAAAEAFVKLQRGAPGSPPVNSAAALVQIKSLAGTELDPRVVGALEAVAWARLNLAPAPEEPPGPAETERDRPTEEAVVTRVRPDLSALTEREQEILHLIAEGYSNRDIARELFLSEATVKTHVSRILQKLALPDRTKAAVYLMRGGRTTPMA